MSGEAVLDVFHARDFRRADWRHLGAATSVEDWQEPYLEALGGFLDTDAIRRAGFTVVIDPVNGAGCRLLAPFARRLGFRLIPVNAEESGHMARDPEPRPRNARQVASVMPLVQAHAGFVTSSDLGRVSLVTEDCETASEEYTFPLIADHVLGGTAGAVVTNCCTTRMVDDVVRGHASRMVKTAVGQACVMAALADEQGVVGGEGNGSVAVPRFSRAFDGLLTIGLVLEDLARRGGTLSGRLRELPRYHMVKRLVHAETRRCYRALEDLQRDADWTDGGRSDATDGLRVEWDDGWVHVRASRTEPMIRITSESSCRTRADSRAVDLARRLEREL